MTKGRCPECGEKIMLFKSSGMGTANYFFGIGTYRCPGCGLVVEVVKYEEGKQ